MFKWIQHMSLTSHIFLENWSCVFFSLAFYSLLSFFTRSPGFRRRAGTRSNLEHIFMYRFKRLLDRIFFSYFFLRLFLLLVFENEAIRKTQQFHRESLKCNLLFVLRLISVKSMQPLCPKFNAIELSSNISILIWLYE